MVLRASHWNLLLLAALATTGLASPPPYALVPRQAQESWATDYDESKISFDGNVAAIQALGLEKAAALASDRAQEEGGVRSDACESTLPETVVTLRFTYAMHYLASSTTNLDTVLSKLEAQLHNKLVTSILVCNAEEDDVEVMLANIVGTATTPLDDPSSEAACVPEDGANRCADYNGKLTLLLAEEDMEEVAIYVALTHVQEILESAAFAGAVGGGLVKVTYTGPAPIIPFWEQFNGGNGVEGSGSSLSGASIAAVAAGGMSLVAFAAVLFAWRRRNDKSNTTESLGPYPGGAVSQMAGSSMLGGLSEIDEERGPTSPFSEMLPKAYRFSENLSVASSEREGLSAVVEVSEYGSSSQQSILVSLSGFSEEAAGDTSDGSSSLDMPNSLYFKKGRADDDEEDIILGAKRKLDSHLSSGNISIDSDSMSDVTTSSPTMSPVKSDEEGDFNSRPHPSCLPSSSLLLLPPDVNTSVNEDASLLFG